MADLHGERRHGCTVLAGAVKIVVAVDGYEIAVLAHRPFTLETGEVEVLIGMSPRVEHRSFADCRQGGGQLVGRRLVEGDSRLDPSEVCLSLGDPGSLHVGGERGDCEGGHSSGDHGGKHQLEQREALGA